MAIVFSDSLSKYQTGEQVSTPRGYGRITEIRDNCAYPIFVRLDDGKRDAFLPREVTPIAMPGSTLYCGPAA